MMIPNRFASISLFLASFSFLMPSLAGDEVVLFDGTSMDGWAHTGPGAFILDSKEKFMISEGGMGMLFYYDEQFEDFDLSLEWSVDNEHANSGVFVRFPNLPQKDRPNDAEGRGVAGPWGAVHEGYEIQIEGESTGSLYSFFPSSNVSTKKPGEWNEMRIKAEGQHYQVWLNGQQVGDYTGERSLKGYIGVQNHDPNSIIRYRNLKLKKL